MESPIQWTWIWANSGRYWRIGKPGVLQFMESQRVGQDLVTKQQHMIYTYTHICLHTHTHNGFLTLMIPFFVFSPQGGAFSWKKNWGCLLWELSQTGLHEPLRSFLHGPLALHSHWCGQSCLLFQLLFSFWPTVFSGEYLLWCSLVFILLQMSSYFTWLPSS